MRDALFPSVGYGDAAEVPRPARATDHGVQHALIGFAVEDAEQARGFRDEDHRITRVDGESRRRRGPARDRDRRRSEAAGLLFDTDEGWFL